MTPLNILGYFLIYGTMFLWLPVAIAVIHHIDKRMETGQWSWQQNWDFKVKWYRRIFTLGLPLWGVIFFIGLLLTNGGLAS